MKVHTLMKGAALTCHATERLSDAARSMWESDCGAIIVVDDAGRAIGMITDRDICMCALLQGKPLDALRVSVAASRRLASVRPSDSIELAEAIMQTQCVRRLPVLDENGKPIGMLTANDLVREAAGPGVHESELTWEPVLKTIETLAWRRA